MKLFREWIERLYGWLRENWWASALFYIIPVSIVSGIKLFGPYLGLVDQTTGALTALGVVIAASSWAFVLFYSLIKEYADSKFINASKQGQLLLRHVSEGAAKGRKLSRFISYIEENDGKPPKNPFPYVTQPERQIGEILQEMQKTFAGLFGIPEYQVGMSLVCKLKNEDEWRVPGRVNVGAAEHILALIHDPNSAFHPIVMDRTQSVFIPKKADALANGRYRPGSRDSAAGSAGSIICIGVDISGQRRYVKGIVSVSTYGKLLYPPGDLASKIKIEEQILSPFVKRLQLELALLYIKTKLYQPE